jgi:hypothetical protein
MRERGEGGPHGVDLECDIVKDALIGRKCKIAIRIVPEKDGQGSGTCVGSFSGFV